MVVPHTLKDRLEDVCISQACKLCKFTSWTIWKTSFDTFWYLLIPFDTFWYLLIPFDTFKQNETNDQNSFSVVTNPFESKRVRPPANVSPASFDAWGQVLAALADGWKFWWGDPSLAKKQKKWSGEDVQKKYSFIIVYELSISFIYFSSFIYLLFLFSAWHCLSFRILLNWELRWTAETEGQFIPSATQSL